MNLASYLVSLVVVVHLCGYGDLHGPGKGVKHADNGTPTLIAIILHLCAVIPAIKKCFYCLCWLCGVNFLLYIVHLILNTLTIA